MQVYRICMEEDEADAEKGLERTRYNEMFATWKPTRDAAQEYVQKLIPSVYWDHVYIDLVEVGVDKDTIMKLLIGEDLLNLKPLRTWTIAKRGGLHEEKVDD